MKKILMIAFLLLIAVSVSAQFRNTKWGMTQEEVMQTEGDVYIQDNNQILYLDEILGYFVEVVFLFRENKLVFGRYKFDPEGANSFKVRLEEKYGKAKTKNFIDYYWYLPEINTMILLENKLFEMHLLYTDCEYTLKLQAEQNKQSEGKF